MKEQEIIEYLKQNKEKGVAFAFMPKEVQDWINNASRKIVYLIFKSGLVDGLQLLVLKNVTKNLFGIILPEKPTLQFQ